MRRHRPAAQGGQPEHQRGIITAISDDMSYEDVVVYQLQNLASRGDVLVTASSSEILENIIRAFDWASKNGVRTIGMSGFAGGGSLEFAEIPLMGQVLELWRGGRRSPGAHASDGTVPPPVRNGPGTGGQALFLNSVAAFRKGSTHWFVS
jgi:hypothetical protein